MAVDGRKERSSWVETRTEFKRPFWKATSSFVPSASPALLVPALLLRMTVKHPHVVAPGVVAPSPFPAEGSSAFSNLHLAIALLAVPKLVQWTFPFLNRSKLYWVLLVLTFIPTLIAYWAATSTFGPRRNTKVTLPGRPITDYIVFHDEKLKQQWLGKKMPMQVLYDLYFDAKLDFKGLSSLVLLPPPPRDPASTRELTARSRPRWLPPRSGDVLEVLESRHDFVTFNFTVDLFK